MYSFRYIAIVIALLGSAVAELRAESAGTVLYDINPRDPYAPVAKRIASKPADGYLQDPNLGGGPVVTIEKPKAPSHKLQLTYVKRKHGFAAAKIKGSLRVPRVVFAQDSLQLDKIPDELPKAFLDKPFTPDATNY